MSRFVHPNACCLFYSKWLLWSGTGTTRLSSQPPPPSAVFKDAPSQGSRWTVTAITCMSVLIFETYIINLYVRATQQGPAGAASQIFQLVLTVIGSGYILMWLTRYLTDVRTIRFDPHSGNLIYSERFRFCRTSLTIAPNAARIRTLRTPMLVGKDRVFAVVLTSHKPRLIMPLASFYSRSAADTFADQFRNHITTPTAAK